MRNIRVLFEAERIQQKVRELAGQIVTDHPNQELYFITVLNGARPFSRDLQAAVGSRGSYKIHNYEIALQSYQGTESTGQVIVTKDLEDRVVEGKLVFIIEDIIDRGVTMDFLVKYLLEKKGVERVKVVSLLDKPSRRLPGININIDYRGFEIEDLFVVGYGLDFDGKHRDLPYIGVLEQ